MPTHVPYLFSFFKMDRILPISAILLAAASPVPKPNAGHEEAKATQSQPRNAANAIPHPPVGFTEQEQGAEEGKPCGKEEENRSSELCAEWHSADEAHEAAKWAARSAYISIFAVLGLLATLVFNWLAWRQAKAGEQDTLKALRAGERSAEAAARHALIAEETSKRRLRAYVSVERASLYSKGAGYKISLEWKNSGVTPAYTVCMRCEFVFANAGWQDDNRVDFNQPGASVTYIGPGGVYQVLDADVPVGMQHGMWASGSRHLFVIVELRYTDCFGAKRFTRNRFRAEWKNGSDVPLIHDPIGNEAT